MALTSRYTLHYDRLIVQKLVALGEPGRPVRQAIRDLAIEPRPDSARTVEERTGNYELFIVGYWVAYRVDDNARIIRIIAITEPS